MNKRATDVEMSDLHGTLAKELKRLITGKHYKKAKNAKGEEIMIETSCSPALLNVARQFLKDNRVEMDKKVYAEHDEFLQPGDLDFSEDTDIALQ